MTRDIYDLAFAGREVGRLCALNAELAGALKKIAAQEPLRMIGDAPLYHGSREIARAVLAKAKQEQGT